MVILSFFFFFRNGKFIILPKLLILPFIDKNGNLIIWSGMLKLVFCQKWYSYMFFRSGFLIIFSVTVILSFCSNGSLIILLAIYKFVINDNLIHCFIAKCTFYFNDCSQPRFNLSKALSTVH